MTRVSTAGSYAQMLANLQAAQARQNDAGAQVSSQKNATDYKGYAAIADYVILMAYDQHWAQGTPGSIAGQSWFEDTLDRRMRDLVAVGAGDVEMNAEHGGGVDE